ncbi:FAD-dependent oxidoreductase, partial [Salmonella enterica]
LVDPAPAPLSRLLPRTAGDVLALALTNQGIDLRLEESVSAINMTDTGLRLSFACGDTLDADVVLSAIGLAPRTSIAANAGLEIDGG